MKKALPSLAVASLVLAILPVVLAQEKKKDAAPPAAQQGAAQQGAAQQAAGPSSDERFARLEAALTQLAQREEAAERRLEEVVAYLAKQANAAGTGINELDSSQRLGFTSGINPQSREVLLAGFRTYFSEVQRGVPTPIPVAPAVPAGPPLTKLPQKPAKKP